MSTFSPEQNQKTFLAYIAELRVSLIHILIFIFSIFLLLTPFSRNIYVVLTYPLLKKLPSNASMIATDVTSTFLAPFKLTFLLAVLITIPFVFYKIWKFLCPALYHRERRIISFILPTSIFLFYSGVAVAYLIVLPIVLGFFITIAPSNVTPMTDVYSYLNFCLKLFLVFGISFQIPIIVLILILLGVTDIETLKRKRPYIIVGCFFIAIFVTPPDIFSMALVGSAMCLLFECGLFLASILILRNGKV